MPIYRVVLRRPITIVERTTVLLDAETEDDAALNAETLVQENPENIIWTETDVCESEIGEIIAEKVTISAFDHSDDDVIELVRED